MMRGARKQMIVIRMSSSRYFDEAYFVLREEAQRSCHKSTDILSEANRILAEVSADASIKNARQKPPWLFFGAGGICGAVLSVIVTLLLL